MNIKRTILFVDDWFKDQGYKSDWNYFFERGGYNLIALSSGGDAIELIENGLQYDLGIVDLRLDDMDGYEVITYAKERQPERPWFIFSAFLFPFPLSDRGIEKPQRPSYLVQVVDDFFKRRGK